MSLPIISIKNSNLNKNNAQLNSVHQWDLYHFTNSYGNFSSKTCPASC
ncbi:hypothetical protein AT1219_40163 [Vibrio alginolyticus]